MNPSQHLPLPRLTPDELARVYAAALPRLTPAEIAKAEVYSALLRTVMTGRPVTTTTMIDRAVPAAVDFILAGVHMQRWKQTARALQTLYRVRGRGE